MWYQNDLGDYELLDASDGQRLERWGKYILIRPDPQIIWKNHKKHPLWKKADAIYTRSSSGGGSWNENSMPESWRCKIAGLDFIVKPMGFKHTGVFPEQASNWLWMEKIISDRIEKGKEVKVLNLFGYTGGATVACAKAGASVCHVDAAKNMVKLCRENMELSGLADAPCRYIVDDCTKFVNREIRRGVKYDAVIMDPPSYGRGPNGEMWHLEDSIHDLINLTKNVLNDDPLFFLVNSYTTGISGSAISYILNLELVSEYGGKVFSDELGIKVKQTDSVLPCGFATRWILE